VNIVSDRVVRPTCIYPCKNDSRVRPLLRKNLAQTDQPSSKTPISINIRSSRLSRKFT